MNADFKDVDLEAGDDYSEYCGKLCRSTYNASPYVVVKDMSKGHFRGPRGILLLTKEYPRLADAILTTAPDGVGTKVALSLIAGFAKSIARDLFAMTGGDITRWGGLRLFFANVLDVESLGKAGDDVRQKLQELMRGLRDVAFEQGVVLLNGETAELGQFVGSVDLSIPVKCNWSGVMIGAFHEDMMILGDDMKDGQIIVALRERGFRSNGLTTVRGALKTRFGDQWWASIDPDAIEAIELSAEPSIIYDRFLEDVNGWSGQNRIPLSAIAHISGGGIPTKFGELLKRAKLSAVLEDLFDPPEIMQKCLEWGGFDHEYGYRRWGGGQGLLAVMDDSCVDEFMSRAKDQRIKATVCGYTQIRRSEAPTLHIKSKYPGGKYIHFPL